MVAHVYFWLSINLMEQYNFLEMPSVPTNNVTLQTYGTLADINTSAGHNMFLVKYQG